MANSTGQKRLVQATDNAITRVRVDRRSVVLHCAWGVHPTSTLFLSASAAKPFNNHLFKMWTKPFGTDSLKSDGDGGGKNKAGAEEWMKGQQGADSCP